MKQVAWMAGPSLAAWLVSAAFVEQPSAIAVFFGMIGPLVMACVSWVMAERMFRQNPQALTGLMVTAFAFKVVFFGGYVALMLRGVGLRPVPFAVSFSSYFIALHFVEAFCLQRLFASGPRV
ncbi:MAG TPA: hypothetical protein VM032_03425 [Vicinamibacterales bacterium]|nr:hypothetical protein [Vicinamibacterales bacterium]